MAFLPASYQFIGEEWLVDVKWSIEICGRLKTQKLYVCAAIQPNPHWTYDHAASDDWAYGS